MQKAGTGTLWQILSRDDRFWMPMVKELAHFNSNSLKPRTIQKARNLQDKFANLPRRKLANKNRRREAKGLLPILQADIDFARNYYPYLLNNRQDQEYLQLFGGAPDGKLTGDITPNYSGMRADKIEHTRTVLPQAHIILLLRNPVERLWSAYNMRLRHDIRDSNADAEDMHDLETIAQASKADMGLEEYIHRVGVKGRSFPSRIYTKWSNVYGAGRVHVVLFEDFISNQKQTVDELYQRLRSETQATAAATTVSPGNTNGIIPLLPRQPTAEKPGETAQSSMHKNKGTKMDLGVRERQILEDFMAEEIELCIDLFGDRLNGWRLGHGH